MSTAELFAEPDKSNLPAPVTQDAGTVEMFERLARDPNASVEKIERLMALWERGQARAAEAAFNEAMAKAQRAMRTVAADASNPQTRSRYASYEAIDKMLRPIYSENGFGLSFDTGDGAPPDYVRVLCYVSHLGGHSRTYHADMPADGKGAKGGDVMTKTHAVGSAMSYGMRYLLKMIFNVAVGEDDDDGNQAGGKVVPEQPDGYPDWLMDLAAAATEGGTPKLMALWDDSSKSKPEFKRFITRHESQKWMGLKQQAAKVKA